MAKVTFYKQPDGRIIQETKSFGKVERTYVTEEQMNKYESQRNSFAGCGCLVVFIFIFYYFIKSQVIE
ncbi:hypothetical protein [Bacillus subtilis]|uniref:hypothetical protein n=2 Tax=Bacillaceae TaxID=186817 RepID=UPI002DB6CD8A|nr:hypothetical protein [Bacillus subtilis]MEC2237371.1 hypothetical protein [Bacillus subtilis]MEC2237565.1 hypothetical protein [Bacillus subtilis]MEC2277094.1 hypothetical protein [Bacillus subtilis]